MKMRYIPNILSASRIPLSLVLPFTAGRYPIAFLICYLLAGITDVLDGILARRFHWESKLGEKFETYADGLFIVCTVITVLMRLGPTLASEGLSGYVYAILAVFAVIRLFNLTLTRVKFQQWGFIHLRSARWVIIPLYLLFPVCIHLERVFNMPVAVCLALSILACVEETFVLFAMEKHEYTISVKSYWEWKRGRARALAIETEIEQEKETTAA